MLSAVRNQEASASWGGCLLLEGSVMGGSTVV